MNRLQIKRPYTKGGQKSINKSEGNSHRAMIARCYNIKYKYYHRYGGRGIVVCDRWLGQDGFINFLNDMGKKPTPKHSIDRIDNDKGYSPENCRWSTQKTQVNNGSRVIPTTISGVTMIRSEWYKIANKSTTVIYKLMKKGMTFEEAITCPNNGIAMRDMRRREKADKSRNICKQCGDKCKSTTTIFCSRKCYLDFRYNRV